MVGGFLRNERFPLLQGDLVNSAGKTQIHYWPYWVEKTANYTMDDVDVSWVYADATAGNITITLPNPPDNRRLIGVKKIDATANTVTLDSGVGNKIDGARTKVISASMGVVQVQCVGLRGGIYQWWVVNS